MKKINEILAGLFLMTLSYSTVFSQATLTISTVNGTAGNPVTVPVTATGITDMVGFQFTIVYDQTKLTYVNSVNWGGGTNTSSAALLITPRADGKVTFVYNGDPVNISSGKFFDLNFSVNTGVSGNASVAWSDNPTPRELSNSIPEIISCVYTNGSVTLPGACSIHVTPLSQYVPNSPGGSVHFSLTSDCAWSASSDQSWCTVNPESGNGNQTLTVTYAENEAGATRTATITVSETSSAGNQVNITVVQKAQTSVTLNFSTGWNIFSSHKLPDEPDMKAIFQPLINEGKLVKIQDENGNSLEDLGFFGGWTNNIGDMYLTEGYKIKVNAACQINITGIEAPLPYAIPLKTGWNIMGYPKETASDGLEIVQQLIGRGVLVKVQDDKGNAIEDLGIFGGWNNFIGDFKPGKGYKIKVSANDILTIY